MSCSFLLSTVLFIFLSGCSCAKSGFDNCVDHHEPSECAKYYHTPKENEVAR